MHTTLSSRHINFTAAAGLTAVVAALLLSALPARAAEAADDAQESHITVHFDDLDLNTAAGTHKLYTRLKGAARTACGDETEVVDLTEFRDIERCEQQAMSTAVAQIARPQLTALYDKYYPREPIATSRTAMATPASTTSSVR